MGPRIPVRDAIDALVQYMAFRLEILRLSYGFHTCASPNRCLDFDVKVSVHVVVLLGSLTRSSYRFSV